MNSLKPFTIHSTCDRTQRTNISSRGCPPRLPARLGRYARVHRIVVGNYVYPYLPIMPSGCLHRLLIVRIFEMAEHTQQDCCFHAESPVLQLVNLQKLHPLPRSGAPYFAHEVILPAPAPSWGPPRNPEVSEEEKQPCTGNFASAWRREKGEYSPSFPVFSSSWGVFSLP